MNVAAGFGIDDIAVGIVLMVVVVGINRNLWWIGNASHFAK
jgi:hypothetical protein